MLQRLFHAVRHANRPSGFEAYLINVQRDGLSGAPTAAEARREYQKMVRVSTIV